MKRLQVLKVGPEVQLTDVGLLHISKLSKLRELWVVGIRPILSDGGNCENAKFALSVRIFGRRLWGSCTLRNHSLGLRVSGTS